MHKTYKRCLEQLSVKGYSTRTSNNYLKAIQQFAHYVQPKQVSELKPQEAQEALRQFTCNRQISSSYKNLLINAVKFYYTKVVGILETEWAFPRPPKKNTAPCLLREKEIKRMLDYCPTTKYKCLLLILCGTGLRMGELLALQRCNVDLKNKMLRVKTANGKKFREVPLPEEVLPALQTYLNAINPRYYLFEGYTEGEAMGERGVQLSLKKIAADAGIKTTVTARVLRNSYITRLLKKGADLHYINTLMGHTSLRSTLHYMHQEIKIKQIFLPVVQAFDLNNVTNFAGLPKCACNAD